RPQAALPDVHAPPGEPDLPVLDDGQRDRDIFGGHAHDHDCPAILGQPDRLPGGSLGRDAIKGNVGMPAQRLAYRRYRVGHERVGAEGSAEPQCPLPLAGPGFRHGHRPATRTAWTAVDSRSTSAAWVSVRLSGAGWNRLAGAVKASAIAPAVWQPTTLSCWQMLYRPARQEGHRPHTRVGSR